MQNPSLRTVEREDLPRDGDHRDRIEVRDLLPDPKRHKSHDDGDAATSDPAKLELKAKQTAALAKLRASFGDKKKASGPTTSATTAGAAKPKPANPALELMRLKQRAVPADPKHVKKPRDVSMVDRLFLNVSFVDADGTRRGDEKAVWVSKVGFAAIHRFPSRRIFALMHGDTAADRMFRRGKRSTSSLISSRSVTSTTRPQTLAKSVI